MTQKEKDIVATLVSKAKIARKLLNEYARHITDTKPLDKAIEAAEEISKEGKVINL